MEYNSQKEKLVISEYGRHIQELILHAKEIEDTEEKQAFMERAIDLMYQMNPQSKNVNDYREKLWRHAFRIADYELEGVVPPGGEIPQAKDAFRRPDPIPYPHTKMKFRHYGVNIEHLVDKAIEMEDEEKRKEFISCIGSYMKLAYKTWNREHYVSDDIVLQDLKALVGDRITFPEDVQLDFLNTPPPRKPRRSSNSSGRGKRRRK